MEKQTDYRTAIRDALAEEMRRDARVVGLVSSAHGLSHVYYMATKGALPCIKLGRAVRFRPADVDRFIRDHKRKQTA